MELDYSTFCTDFAISISAPLHFPTIYDKIYPDNIRLEGK